VREWVEKKREDGRGRLLFIVREKVNSSNSFTAWETEIPGKNLLNNMRMTRPPTVNEPFRTQDMVAALMQVCANAHSVAHHLPVDN
jgi:hypothetical protein